MARFVFMPKKLYGVLGWPLGHSLSPLIHNTGFQFLDLDGVYLKWEVNPADLAAFAASVRILPISGCSVTIPHKIGIMPLLDRLDPGGVVGVAHVGADDEDLPRAEACAAVARRGITEAGGGLAHLGHCLRGEGHVRAAPENHGNRGQRIAGLGGHIRQRYLAASSHIAPGVIPARL